MNPSLKRFFSIAEASERRIIGLMSGTSLDGLDMALCRFRGSGQNTECILENFYTYPYPSEFKEKVLRVYSKEKISLQDLCLLNEWIGIEHGKIINQQILNWGLHSKDIDLIASHGQSVFHAPKSLHKDPDFPNGTLQIGDGDHIAQTCHIITLSDFRQKQIAAGGEGAPLAPYGDFLLFSSPDRNRIFVNIGGISNFTFLPVKNSGLGFQSSDLGPGNTLMDRFVQIHFPGYSFDPNGEISDRGRVVPELLKLFFEDSFFAFPFPKSTGPERFNIDWLNKLVNSLSLPLSPEDIMATLNEFSAEAIYRGIEGFLLYNPEIYFSGGGIHNKALMNRLRQKLSPRECLSTDLLGINPDAKEAVLFALLANEALVGNPRDFTGENRLYPSVSMGKISLPG